jgi:hypothetical protein
MIPSTRTCRLGLQFLTLGAIFCLLVLGVLGQVAAALANASERDVTYRYFDEALSPMQAESSAVTWLEPATPLARPFGAAEQRIVGLALTRAWSTHAVALETGSPLGLPDFFAGVALERATRSLSVPGARMVVLEQAVRPVFFHADGSILQVETEAIVVRFHLDDAGALDGFAITRDTTRSTLRNEATGWRITNHERLDAVDMAGGATGAEVPPAAGLNYYPSLTPWSRFWPEFDAAIVARDFARIAALGANSVRVFLQREDFLDPRRGPAALTDLQTLLDLAGEAGLTVVPTLFDMRGGYGTVTWANDMVYLDRVMPVLAASDHVAYVDLKNEPDLDMDHHGSGHVEAWARAMLAAARGIAPDLAYTIGWAHPSAARVMADTLDLITYHDYGPVEESRTALADVRRVAGDRPVHVTEIGATSFSLLAGRFPSSPEAQARHLSARLDALSGADGLFVWTLHDFPDPDPVAVGHSPWVIGLQGQFGLFTSTGAPKPAADTVARAFADFMTDAQGDLQ